MGAASHLGIRLRDYDARIRTFIPRYEEMLDAAASVLPAIDHSTPLVVDLGIGSGALADRCRKAMPRARFIGVDSDADMLAFARKRLGRQLTTITSDFTAVPLPRCDAITASFALHHVATRARKRKLYARCFAALRRGGLLINADCCLASTKWLQLRDRAAWRAHLQRSYSRSRAETYLKTWGKEDVYFPLHEEVEMLESAGFTVDIPWRRDSFAVIVGGKR